MEWLKVSENNWYDERRDTYHAWSQFRLITDFGFADFGDGEVEIDIDIYPAIVKLNQLGIKTDFCCSGIHSKEDDQLIRGYILLKEGYEFPSELLHVWKVLGFNHYLNPFCGYRYIIDTHILGNKVSTKKQFQLSQVWVETLNDWVNDYLDETAKKYLSKLPKKKKKA